ncbi:MAG: class I SAM-dependent methyltransferase [Patescibacteria group bacterium]
MARGTSSSLKKVSPKLYTKKYYLEDCSGYELYKKTKGDSLDDRLQKIVTLLPDLSGANILDIGCGRGELAIYLAKKGNHVTGIDYSKEAIDLANLAKSHQPKKIKSRLDFRVLDIDKLSRLDKQFDLIVCTEVWEHIYPLEQESLLTSARQLLRPAGQIFIHTAPSRWFNDYTYRLWCYPVSTLFINVWNLIFSKQYGNIPPYAKLRTHYHKLMHINEPDYYSLKNIIQKNGFAGEIRSTNITVNKPVLSFKDVIYNFLVYLSPLSSRFPLNVFWGNDFWILAKKI